MKPGAHYLGDGQCDFTVWAPTLTSVAVHLLSPTEQTVPLKPDGDGYWHATVAEVYPGARYRYVLQDGAEFPDPASRSQPEGVHGPSEVVDSAFEWSDDEWRGLPRESLILYELHVGTFTPEGTFTAIIPRLPALKALGITMIELMPIAQFSGDAHVAGHLAYRNWGYDGTYPYAVQVSYGTPNDLKHLVNACHQQGIGVMLDVVYNHLGPEGNYLDQFAPYFTDTYQTPWGRAINFDNAHSPGTRHYFLENALYWLREFHLDGLRLDAIQAIYDFGARHVLQELADAVRVLEAEQQRTLHLIAESDLNDPRVIRPSGQGGYGLDAQWSDDFHHALHALLTGDRQGYYQDFGRCADLAKAYTDTFVYDWKYAPHRQRFHGMPCGDRPPTQFVVCSQNHDQIGNQLKGERLSHTLSFDGAKLAAGAVLLSPYLPLLFMGEEYGEPAPFTYFVSHADRDLIQAVREGRKREFEAFHAEGEPLDPEAADTFLNCKLNWHLRTTGQHAVLLNWYRHLIHLRTTEPALLMRDRASIRTRCDETDRWVMVQRHSDTQELLLLLNFNSAPSSLTLSASGSAHKRLDSADTDWLGAGASAPETVAPGQSVTLAPVSLVLYELTPQ